MTIAAGRRTWATATGAGKPTRTILFNSLWGFATARRPSGAACVREGGGETGGTRQMLHCSTTVALGGRATRGGASAALSLGPRPRAEDPREPRGSLLSQTFSLPDRLGRAFGPGSFLP